MKYCDKCNQRMVAEQDIERHRDLISRLKNTNSSLEEALEFTLNAAELLYGTNQPLEKNLCPTFYHTLTYEGDLKLIEKTKDIKALLDKKE